MEVHNLTYTNNAMATILFCSHLGIEKGDVKPYTTKEWNVLQDRLKSAGITEPGIFLEKKLTELGQIFYLSEEEQIRIDKLLSRGAIVALLLEKYSKRGIHVVTRAEHNFPKLLRKRLKLKTPPFLFYCGDLDLANKMGIAVVGSRSLEEQGIHFVQELAEKAVKEKLAIYSGGAKGVDSIAQQTAIANGGIVVSYIADAMTKKIQNRDIIQAIENKQLLLLSDTNPDVGFTVAKAMNRNKYIYASSCGAVAVASDLKKGGTWTGAIENLNQKWVALGVWDTNLYSGNKELITKGAVPIESVSDFSVKDFIQKSLKPVVKEEAYQLNLFTNKVSEEIIGYEIKNDSNKRRSYEIFLPFLLESLTVEKNIDQLCDEFDVVKKQMQHWLNQAVADETVVKLTRPVRYIKN